VGDEEIGRNEKRRRREEEIGRIEVEFFFKKALINRQFE
jgi:hypothetical protein